MNLVLPVLAASTLAALAGALGATVYMGPPDTPRHWLGWAFAVAAGFMLGAAYATLHPAVADTPVVVTAGALLGILFVFATHRFQGTADLELSRTDAADPTYVFRVLTIQALHSASEGVAIGVAALANLGFGLFVAFAFAVHNVAEAIVLSAVLRGQGASAAQAAALGVFTNVGQILLAIVTVALVTSAPALLPWTVGFAVGTLVHLVLIELLPEAYREAGSLSTALATSLAMGVVILWAGVLG